MDSYTVKDKGDRIEARYCIMATGWRVAQRRRSAMPRPWRQHGWTASVTTRHSARPSGSTISPGLTVSSARCPHGRPVVFELPLADLERRVGRR